VFFNFLDFDSSPLSVPSSSSYQVREALAALIILQNAQLPLRFIEEKCEVFGGSVEHRDRKRRPSFK